MTRCCSGSGYKRNDTLLLNDINQWEVQSSRSANATLNVPFTGDSFRVNFQLEPMIRILFHTMFASTDESAVSIYVPPEPRLRFALV